MTGWGFLAPWLLAGLAVLPCIWWLLRLRPPAPRREIFPAVVLLLGLETGPTPARTVWWLLLLRLAAAALAVVGLAGPVHRLAPASAGGGPVLLLIDDGWAAAPDWAARLRAAAAALSAYPPDTPGWLLATAPDAAGDAPDAGPLLRLDRLADRLAALRPLPWATDRAAAAAALRTLPATTRVVYIADGIAGAGDPAFAAALGRFAAVTERRGTHAPWVLRGQAASADGLTLRAASLPGAASPTLRALNRQGEAVAETVLPALADGTARGTLVLPPALRGQVTALRLADDATAAGVLLLDGGARRRPVGLLSHGPGDDQPLTGPLYYVQDALQGTADLRRGGLDALLSQPLAVIIAADQDFADPATVARLTRWVRAGGLLIRFAGPMVAAADATDTLLPVPLIAGDRSLGGALSWSRLQGLAEFPPGSPFRGLAVPAEVQVRQQVLTRPDAGAGEDGRHQDGDENGRNAGSAVWASLADGTPLVTAQDRGAGGVVLFHVTANAAWSNLPLSGLFPAMLQRLVQRSAGLGAQSAQAPLEPLRVLDGYGDQIDPGPAVQPLADSATATAMPGPTHPPGLYGAAGAARAFNLGAVLPRPLPAAPIAGAVLGGLDGTVAARSVGPALLAASAALLALDLLLTLRLRGLIGAMALVVLLGPRPAGADPAPGDRGFMPALATHLAYVVTGDSQADGISRAGLQGLSEQVNQRTAAVLADPVGVDPAHDTLDFYPLLYWPILADAPLPDGATLARIADYMADGGVILFDTRDAAAPDAGADDAMRRIGTALAIPPLARLTPAHVLSHSFFLLRDWPGRAAGAAVWVAAAPDPARDGVSPVVIGANDWAAAWAVDAQGDPPYAVLPGGEAQRRIAYRFGINLVMYALTGSYKADQVHVPELLRRIGEDHDAMDEAP